MRIASRAKCHFTLWSGRARGSEKKRCLMRREKNTACEQHNDCGQKREWVTVNSDGDRNGEKRNESLSGRVDLHLLGVLAVGSERSGECAAAAATSARRALRSAAHRLVAFLLIAPPVARQVARHEVRRLGARWRAPVRRLVPPVQPVHEQNPLPQRVRLRAPAARRPHRSARSRLLPLLLLGGTCARDKRLPSNYNAQSFFQRASRVEWNSTNCPNSNRMLRALAHNT